MAVYREGYAALETIRNRSKRIFPDAADYGMPIKKNSADWRMVKQLIDDYGIDNTRKENNYGCEHQIKLIDEWAVSDERKTLTQATEIYKVAYVKVRNNKEMDGYIEITRITA